MRNRQCASHSNDNDNTLSLNKNTFFMWDMMLRFAEDWIIDNINVLTVCLSVRPVWASVTSTHGNAFRMTVILWAVGKQVSCLPGHTRVQSCGREQSCEFNLLYKRILLVSRAWWPEQQMHLLWKTTIAFSYLPLFSNCPVVIRWFAISRHQGTVRVPTLPRNVNIHPLVIICW